MFTLSVRERLELVSRLREKGFYVRWHAYEFLLGYGGRIVGVLLLEPSRSAATLYLGEGLEEVARLVEDALSPLGVGVRVVGVSRL